MKYVCNPRTAAGLLLFVALFLVGCEDSVNSLVGSEKPYTLWGFMNAGADTQLVRVFPINDTLIPAPETGIDAQVFSTDLDTGERREWTYRPIQFDSLIAGHVFWAPFRAEHNHRYRLDVIRSDGATTSSEVVVPPEIELIVEANSASTIIPVQIRGEVPVLLGARVTYHAINVPPGAAWPIGTPVMPAVQHPVTISYDQLVRQTNGGWAFTIDMIRDYQAVRSAYEQNCLVTSDEESAPDIWLRRMDFSVVTADSTWVPPGGVFDPNVLSVPGTFSNVENGFGFFGAGVGIIHDWSPNLDVAQSVGYRAVTRCNGLFDPRDIPECHNPPMPCLGEHSTGIWEEWLN